MDLYILLLFERRRVNTPNQSNGIVIDIHYHEEEVCSESKKVLVTLKYFWNIETSFSVFLARQYDACKVCCDWPETFDKMITRIDFSVYFLRFIFLFVSISLSHLLHPSFSLQLSLWVLFTHLHAFCFPQLPLCQDLLSPLFPIRLPPYMLNTFFHLFFCIHWFSLFLPLQTAWVLTSSLKSPRWFAWFDEKYKDAIYVNNLYKKNIWCVEDYIWSIFFVAKFI